MKQVAKIILVSFGALFLTILIIAFIVGAIRGLSQSGTQTASSPQATATSSTMTFSQYTSAIDQEATPFINSLNTVGTLVQNAQTDNPVWVSQMQTQFAIWTKTNAEASALRPPACVSVSNSHWVTATRDYKIAGDDLNASFTSQNTGLVDAAKTLMNDGTQELQLATDTIDATACAAQ